MCIQPVWQSWKICTIQSADLLLCRQPLLLDLHPDPPPCLHGSHTSHRLLLANDQGWWGNQSRPVKYRTLLKSIFSSRTPGCPGQFKTLLPKHPPFPLSHLRYQTCISPLEEQWERGGWNPENWLLIKIRTTAITKLTQSLFLFWKSLKSGR